MASRAISRLLLVLALIIAAHAFKPISSRSVVEQLLSAAESLSFVLPDVAEVRIAQASYLANAFGQQTGERGVVDSRLTEHEPAVGMPAVLAFGQSLNPIEHVSCGAPKKVRRAGVTVARSRMQPLIPELPVAMPLSRAMAMALPLPDAEATLLTADFDLISMPARRFDLRLIRRRPIAPPKKSANGAACESTVIAVSEAEGELGQNEGPQEEFEDLISEMEATMKEEAVETAEAEPTTPSQSPRNCPVQIPEMVIPQSVFGTPKE